MTALVTSRKNRKLATLKRTMESHLGADVVHTIFTMASTVTVRVQREPVQEDHSVALSGPQGRHIMVSLFETGPKLLWMGFLPDGPGGSITYTTGHDFFIRVERLNGAGMMRVHVESDETDSDEENGIYFSFRGAVNRNTQHQRVDVHDGIYVMLDFVQT